MNKHQSFMSFQAFSVLALISMMLLGLLLWFGILGATAQALSTLLLVLVLPGYVLMALLFDPRTLGRAEQLLFSLVGSMGIVAIGSLLLNRTPWGLQATSWLLLVAGVTVIGGIAAFFLRSRTVAQELRPAQPLFNLRQGLLLIAALLVAGVAINVAQRPAPAAAYEGYTLLWMLPDYTTSVAGGGQRVELGIDSKEFMATTFALRIKVDDELAHEWSSITLTPNQQWQAAFALTQAQAQSNSVYAELYRQDVPDTIYRRVNLRATVTE
jgi:uncharacterized membrane protein